MSKFTKGNWIAVGAWVEIDDDNIPDIAICDPASMGQLSTARSYEEACANARLIAAAPELLWILERAENLLFASAEENAEVGSYGRDCFEVMTATRFLISKATGETT